MAMMYSSDAFLNQALGNLGGALGSALGKYQSNNQQQQQQSALQQALSGLGPDASQIDLLQAVLGSGLNQNQAVELFKGYKPAQKATMSEAEREKIIGLTRAQNTLNRFDALVKKGNVGTSYGFDYNPQNITGDVGRDRAELQKLGQSLIPLVASGVSIRNQKEFDEYSKIITNPKATIAQLQGASKALRDMINDEVRLRTGQSQQQQMTRQPNQPKYFDIEGARAAGYTDQQIKDFLESNKE